MNYIKPLVFTVVAVFSLSIGIWYSLQSQPVNSFNNGIEIVSGGYVYSTARELPQFELIDQYGKPFNHQSLKGKWTMMFFGYTFCPDICPAALSQMKAVYNELGDAAKQVQVVFVSVDPKRDTPARLAEYMPFFHPDFMGVSGEIDELNKLSERLGAIYVIAKEQNTESYSVDHSANFFLINPEGKQHALLTAPHDITTLTKLLKAVTKS